MPTLAELFPTLDGDNHHDTSPKTPDYNCVAWAAEENDRWWWPDPQYIGYWPAGVTRTIAIEYFVRVFATLEYQRCQDGNLEGGYQKVAIYTRDDGTPTHMSRQLPDGTWTSKLGQAKDINHYALEALHGPAYGTAQVYLKRPAPQGGLFEAANDEHGVAET